MYLGVIEFETGKQKEKREYGKSWTVLEFRGN